MAVFLVSALLCLVVLALSYLSYRLLYAPYQVHKRYGIRGPRPTPFWGSYWDIKRMGERNFWRICESQYGSLYGFYLGSKFTIVTTDLDIVKEVFVKQFDNFVDRGSFATFTSLLGEANGYPGGLFDSTGDVWKVCRHTLSPAFSTLKLKQMLPLVKRSCDTLVHKLGEAAASEQSTDLHKFYTKFSMEITLATSLGCYVEIQNGEAHPVVEAASETLNFLRVDKFPSIPELLVVFSHFPVVVPILRQVMYYDKGVQGFGYLLQTGASIVEARSGQDTPSQTKDLIHLMLDAKMENKDGGGEILSTAKIASIAAGFLAAGYETVANLLSFTSYLLAMHPEVQERLQSEIDEWFENNDDGSLYDAIKSIQYLDMVIQESLRVFSPSSSTILARKCEATTEIKGVIIPKGTDVIVPMFILHNNPEYWPDPDTFDPERFSAEERAKRPQLAHMPFGWGPRNCIGMRLALLEVRLTFIEILRQYTLLRSPDTEIPPQVSIGITDSPKNGIILKIKPRE